MSWMRRVGCAAPCHLCDWLSRIPQCALREILEPVDYHLVRDTPVLTVLRCMDDGAWDELPVVDSEGRYWEAVFRKPLLMNLLIGGISAGEALPGFLESRWAQVGVEWLM